MTKWAGLAAFFLCSLPMAGHAQWMYVKEKSGIEAIFAIHDIRKITFSGGNMTVNGLYGNSEAFALTDIRYVNFTDLLTGIYPLEKQKPELLILFPNPTQDILIFNYKSLGEAIQFEVMTLDGKTVLGKIIHMPSGVNQVKVNVSSLPKGLYICRLIEGKAVLINKFLKY